MRILARELKISEWRISLHCRALRRIRHNPILRRGAAAIQPSWILRDVALNTGKKKNRKGTGGVYVKLTRLRKRWAKSAAVSHLPWHRIVPSYTEYEKFYSQKSLEVIEFLEFSSSLPFPQIYFIFHAIFRFTCTGRKINIFVFIRFTILDLQSFSFIRDCILFPILSIQLFARFDSISRHATREKICFGNFLARALSHLHIQLNDCRLLFPNEESKYHAVSGREERQVCQGIMKFAGKISEADVSNVTWSVLSFYANKSGGRLISPWCSDTTVAVAIVNVGVGVGVVDGRDDAWRQPKIRFQPGLRHSELCRNGCIDDSWC